MKTSLNIEDEVFESAKKESHKTGKTLSEVLSFWARRGRDEMRKKNKVKKKFQPLNLGKAQIDLTSRKEWMEVLEE